MSAQRPGISTPGLAIAIRHVHFEDCGSLVEALLERNVGIRYIDVGRHELTEIDAGGADLIVGLGGPVSVYDERRYPWIRDELALFERCVQLGKPVLGICLGAQMLARVLGARVYPGPVKELGWKPLTLTEAGRDSLIAPLGSESTSMLHWHGDTFDLPGGATLLASTAEVPNQVFSWRNTLAFQCHPEVKGEDFERWLIGHSAEIDATAGASVTQLREATARHAPLLTRQASRVFRDWLVQVGL